MNIQEAILSKQFVSRPSWDQDQAFRHYAPNTGPYAYLVDCDYFVFIECGLVSFSTSGPDLYAEELLATDYEKSQITELEFNQMLERTKKLEAASLLLLDPNKSSNFS